MLFLSITVFSCQNRKEMKRYNWQPTSSAPSLYPVKIHAAYMRYGRNSALAVPSSARVCNGLGQPGMTYSLNSEAYYPLPTGLDIVWLSLVDKRFYEAEVDFPVDTLRRLMEEGYINGKGEKESYHYINVGFIPGGRIVIYLHGYEKRVVLSTFQGKETEVDMESFLPNAYFAYKDYDAYFDDVFSDTDEEWLQAFRKYGPNHGLWDKYFERFDYDIDFEFEEKSSYIRFFGIDFANSEACDLNKYNPRLSIRPAARPRLIAAGWSVDGFDYSAWFYFDEEEVLRVFDEAFSEHRGEPGRLRIFVSKYNNLFDIGLELGGKVYALKETQIRVFKQRPDEGDEDAELIYKNYEQDFYTPFVGE